MSKIFLCQPTYNNVRPESAQSFWFMAHSAELTPRIVRMVGGGSLLAKNFNMFWTQALNMREEQLAKGEDPITYFVMMHDDVQILEPNWVDTLLEGLLKANVDVLSAVIPMKGQEGLTSTAIDNPNDRWNPERRLTIKEVLTLPETFTAKDCGYERKLLVNTGCFIARLDRPWATATNEDGTLKVRFTIRDAISRKDGKWQYHCEPEDWGFSRDVQELGGTVAATRSLKIGHYGSIPYINYDTWGSWSYDEPFVNKPINT